MAMCLLTMSSWWLLFTFPDPCSSVFCSDSPYTRWTLILTTELFFTLSYWYFVPYLFRTLSAKESSVFMCLAHFLPLFLITHLSGLCHCFGIINSYCIRRSPVAWRLGLANIGHPKTKPAFRDLKFTCSGLGCIYLHATSSFHSCQCAIHFLNANSAALSIGMIYAFGKGLCSGCCALHPTTVTAQHWPFLFGRFGVVWFWFCFFLVQH